MGERHNGVTVSGATYLASPATTVRSSSTSGRRQVDPVLRERAAGTAQDAQRRALATLLVEGRGDAQVAMIVVGSELDRALDDPPRLVEIPPPHRDLGAQVEQLQHGPPRALARLLGPLLVGVVGQQRAAVAGDRGLRDRRRPGLPARPERERLARVGGVPGEGEPDVRTEAQVLALAPDRVRGDVTQAVEHRP